MTRVAENTRHGIVGHHLARAKEKLQELQLQGATLKRILRPSDDPAGNVRLMRLRTQLANNRQFVRNLDYARSHVELTENALGDLAKVISRAKEIALAQSSDAFGPVIRRNTAQEVEQLLHQTVTIGNRRIGQRYLFAGYATHRRPFDREGNYFGDNGHRLIEIEQELFVPINLTGREVFFPHQHLTAPGDGLEHPARGLFGLVEGLRDALVSGNARRVQGLLQGLDQAFSRLMTLRTQLGAIDNAITRAEGSMANDQVSKQGHQSKIEDADVGRLLSELEKQNNLLRTAYKSGAASINRGLVDFLR